MTDNHNNDSDQAERSEHQSTVAALPVSRDYYPEPSKFRRELKRAGPIYDALSESVEQMIANVRVGRSLDPEGVRAPLKEMIDSIIRHPDAMLWKRKLDTQESYLTGHSVRCAVLAVVVARTMGFAEPQLERLGLGALLCQIGKTKIPRKLLEQDTPLSEEETERVLSFIRLGAEMLRECQTIGEDIIEIVLNHQERFDGSGYPEARSEDAIPMLARFAGLVDWYDAATTRKPHTARIISATEAMEYLYEQRDTLFQGQLVEEFIRAMGIYPTGNLVELNTGEVALIQAQNRRHRTQPRILIVLDRNKKPLEPYRLVDLLEHNQTTHDRPLTIKRTLPSGELDLDPNEIMERQAEQKSGLGRALGSLFGR